MIKRRTVFVLGAGASEPYGFPAGLGLRDAICDSIRKGEASDDVAHLFNRDVADSLNELAQDLFDSGISIDEWFGTNVQDENLRHLGRFLISRTLCRLEKQAAFEAAYGKNKHWYGTLWGKLRPRTIEGLQDLEAVFITFNYDRSLEHAFMTMAKATFKGVAEKMYEECVSSIPIFHVHGQLGRLPWQSSPDKLPIRNYDSNSDPKSALQCGAGIHFVGDEAAEDSFRRARTQLRKAEEIHFLGFGFHPANLSRLHVDDIKTNDIHGTCVGMGARECESLTKGMNQFGEQINLHRENVETYIHNMVDGWGE